MFSTTNDSNDRIEKLQYQSRQRSYKFRYFVSFRMIRFHLIKFFIILPTNKQLLSAAFNCH